MAKSSHERDEEQRREALATLRGLNEREGVVSSALAQAARRAGDHFAARDAMHDGKADPIELWGRRIGRGFSLLALIGLLVYFYFMYFAK